MKYKQVVIWGHPLYSHTHSYIHEAFFKAFKHLGYQTYWFHNGEFPQAHEFDYSNTLFLTEGFADQNIPINDSSCYVVSYAPNPLKYSGAEEFIELRPYCQHLKDHIYDFDLSEIPNLQQIGPVCFLKPKTQEQIHYKNKYYDYFLHDYNVVYMSWATNLLPHEINLNDAYNIRDESIYFCGTIAKDGNGENLSTLGPFVQACRDHNIHFHHNDPWVSPISSKELCDLVQKSFMAPDIRGPLHLDQKYIPCRIFKNISYGQFGLTNSVGIFENLDGNCVYNNDTYTLFEDGLKNRNEIGKIQTQMKYVRDHHTYVNRIKSLMKVIE